MFQGGRVKSYLSPISPKDDSRGDTERARKLDLPKLKPGSRLKDAGHLRDSASPRANPWMARIRCRYAPSPVMTDWGRTGRFCEDLACVAVGPGSRLGARRGNHDGRVRDDRRGKMKRAQHRLAAPPCQFYNPRVSNSAFSNAVLLEKKDDSRGAAERARKLDLPKLKPGSRLKDAGHLRGSASPRESSCFYRVCFPVGPGSRPFMLLRAARWARPG
jgi:hypothetical protein